MAEGPFVVANYRVFLLEGDPGELEVRSISQYVISRLEDGVVRREQRHDVSLGLTWVL